MAARRARAATVGHAAAAAHGAPARLQIFALAFLFRLQSQLLGWGPLVNFLKVDILNMMGLAMVAAALPVEPLRRARAFGSRCLRSPPPPHDGDAARARVPCARAAARCDRGLLRPSPAAPTSRCFPWAGFLFARRDRRRARRRRAHRAARAAAAGRHSSSPASPASRSRYCASFQPSIYPMANFWTSSPTFFFIELGLHGAAADRMGDRRFQSSRAALATSSAPDVPGR